MPVPDELRRRRLVVVRRSRDAAGGLEPEDVRSAVWSATQTSPATAIALRWWRAGKRRLGSRLPKLPTRATLPGTASQRGSPSGQLGAVRVRAATRNGDAGGLAVRDPHERGAVRNADPPTRARA